jgi:SPP1 family predicted phage head-tail adaptor
VLHAGRLRHVLTLQRENASQDANGESVPSWTNVSTGVWGEILFVNGSEQTQAGQTVATNSVTITVRKRSDVTITPQHRWLWNGKVFNIISAVDPTGIGEELICQCIQDAG